MAVRSQFTSIQLMFLLLCSALLATTLQGVQGEVDVEGPSESECRPYIEKALKKLETGDAQSAEVQDDDIAHIVTTDDSDTQGDSLEITDAETSKSAEEGTQEDVEDVGQSQEQDTSAETGDTQEASAEEKDVEDSETDGATEEVADESAEQVQDEASAEKDTQETQSEEKQDETAEQTSVEEATAEQASAEELAAEPAEEVDEGSVEQDGSVEKDGSAEEGAEGAEDEGSVEQEGSQEQADEPKGEESAEQAAEESAEQTAESAEQAEGSVEQKEESGEEKAESEERKEESGEQKDESAEQTEEAAAESAEQAAESVEQADVESAEQADAESAEQADAESAEQAAESAEKADAESAEQADAESTEQAAESAEQATESEEPTSESAEQAAESAEQGEASVEQKEESDEQKDESVEQKEESGEQKEESTEKSEGEASQEQDGSAEQEGASVEKEASAEEKESAEKQESGEVAEEAESVEKTESAEKAEKAESDEEKVTDDADKESAEQEQADEAASTEEATESESTPEEDLTWEIEIPTDLRPRDHVNEILHLNEETSEVDGLLLKAADSTLKELKRIYENAIQPLETLYKYRDLSNRHFGDPEIFSKPLVLFMGPWSGGKSSIINYLLDNEYTQNSLRTGAEPSPAYFNLLMHGEEPAVLDGTQLAADWTFSGLQKFGQGLEERLRGLKLPNKLLEKINIAEIPGILEVRKQVSRVFPFNDACQWFIDRADIIFLVYDPSKLDVGPETEAILDQLKGREYQTRIILNKADQVKPEELMRVQGALIWNISPLMSSAQPPVMYSTSLWSKPYEVGAPIRLLHAQERAFLRDLKSAIDKRIENKIASARRFAVRVRNHAKMVDCYLTTYYNHKSVFGNKKIVADQIIEHPQDYHIYEGLSTLTNISRYDLPDPDVYRDFFRLNPLYDFQQLSATCTYFRGCPINRLDIAIAYDLPELVGKYKKTVETIQAGSNTDSSTKS